MGEKKQKTPTFAISYPIFLALLFTCPCSSSPLGARGGAMGDRSTLLPTFLPRKKIYTLYSSAPFNK